MLYQWSIESGTNPDAARALLDGYRRRAGDGVPVLGLESFTAAITGWLNWLHNQACEVIDPESPDKAEFAELALRATLDDPLRVATLQELLDAAGAGWLTGTRRTPRRCSTAPCPAGRLRMKFASTPLVR